MKLKLDFVTNSSSTSFIIACKKKLTAEEFVNNLWKNGLGEAIKEILINNLRCGKFPLEKGVNGIHAYSENYDNLFDQIFYNFSETVLENLDDGDDFAIREGCIETFTDEIEEEREYCEEFLNKFPSNLRGLIEEFIKEVNNEN